MSSSSNVLREYLVSLGYSVDNVSQKKFDLALLNSDRSASGLARTLLGVAASAQAMMLVYARSMERLYYSSMKAESSVGSLQAISFAAKNIGLSGDAMVAGVEGMARAMRTNPGLKALLTGQFGINTQGKETTALLVEFVEKLSTMPDYIATSFAQMFGIDPDTYFLLSRQVGQFKEVMALRKQWSKDMGLDSEQGVEAMREYANATREVEERLKILGQVVAVSLLPPFREATRLVNQALADLSNWISRKGPEGQKQLEEFTGGRSPLKWYWEFTKKFWGFKSELNQPSKPQTTPAPSSSSQTDQSTAALFGRLEKQYGLPEGLLDRIYAVESNRGRNVGKSRAGAEGPFQFMPSTAKQYGVDVKSLESSATGAARYLRDLLDMYGGDLQRAVAGYNWGQGKLNRYGLGAAPAETRRYVQSVLGAPITIHQDVNIRVDGAGSPEATARAVGREQTRVNGDLVRNLGRGPQ